MGIQHNSTPYQCLTSWQRLLSQMPCGWSCMESLSPCPHEMGCIAPPHRKSWPDTTAAASGKPRSRNSFVWVCCSMLFPFSCIMQGSALVFMNLDSVCAIQNRHFFITLLGTSDRTNWHRTWMAPRIQDKTFYRLHRHHLHPRSCKFILLGWKRHNTITFQRAAWCISRALWMIPELDGSHDETSRLSMLILILSTSLYIFLLSLCHRKKIITVQVAVRRYLGSADMLNAAILNGALKRIPVSQPRSSVCKWIERIRVAGPWILIFNYIS